MQTFTIPVGSGRPGQVAGKTGNKAKLSPARAGAWLSLATATTTVTNTTKTSTITPTKTTTMIC